ncbi:unnamed protein product (macronuclear) [Paramecium tetraurelia]|uniref:EF-hand domain-containing protein n=1 Tax=Paramecium tetraurelia TaxID=5888 RepID=A0EBF8_PARTE|nr:uncharacterized protein GSPATT00025359001 [Paramecium tetraurelia]CAK92625.1 unnamed protein product [Paramecium tetraurelia]|eukprot:XP_001460022.1 hypothetical protein (macronuclear) [Paramecium tetraurelia strain d4-2]
MLNKYTLTFKDKILEQKYQDFQTQQKRKPLLQKIIFTTFIVIITKLISSIINFSYKEIYFTIGYLAGNIGLIVIFKFQPQWIRWVLMMINYILLFVYSEPDDGKAQFQYQLASALIISFQFIVMRTGEFIDTLIQVVSFYSFYFIYLLLYQPNFSISVALATFLVVFLLIITFYENVSAERSKFQLTIVDDKWEEVLQNILVEPCVMFSFNYLNSSFIFKRSIEFMFTIETTDQLKQFLRKSKVNQDKKINLEDFIYKKVKELESDHMQLWNQKVTIYYEKKVQDVYFSILQGTSPIILIKVKQFKFQSNEKVSDIENQYQYKYKMLIKSILLQLRLVGQFQFPALTAIFKIIMYHYLLEKLEYKQITKIKIDKIINQLRLVYPQKQISVEILQLGSPIFGQRDSLCLILMEVFETILSNQIHLKVINQHGSTQLQIYGVLNERAKEKLKSRLLNYQSILENVDITDLCVNLGITNEMQSLDWVIKQ